MKKEAKTNAMRILERNKIKYKEHLYESDGFADGVTIANKLNQPTERVFKTLVAVGKSKNHYVFVVPVDDSAQGFENIIFSGGRRGAQIEMNPSELAGLIGAEFAHIVQD